MKVGIIGVGNIGSILANLLTVKGSAELLRKRGKHPGEFRHLVTSPGGTQ